MHQRFKIALSETDPSPIYVDADSRDALVFERTNRRGRTAVDLQNGASAEDCYDLAYAAARRTGVLDVQRKEFDRDYVVEAVGDVVESDPTSPAH